MSTGVRKITTGLRKARSHAWVEALLPGLGWVGFDPTNNLIAGERHIRTAIGRDYADVPPTKGIFKGESESQLTVSVRVAPSDAPPPPEQEITVPPEEWQAAIAAADEAEQSAATAAATTAATAVAPTRSL